MKKMAVIMGLVAIAALPACSNQNGEDHSYRHDGDRDNANRTDWKTEKERKMKYAVNYFFDEADTNHDGTISLSEQQAFSRKMFREADTNHDGKLTREEAYAFKHSEMEDVHKQMRSRSRDDTMRDDNMPSSGNSDMKQDEDTGTKRY